VSNGTQNLNSVNQSLNHFIRIKEPSLITSSVGMYEKLFEYYSTLWS